MWNGIEMVQQLANDRLTSRGRIQASTLFLKTTGLEQSSYLWASDTSQVQIWRRRGSVAFLATMWIIRLPTAQRYIRNRTSYGRFKNGIGGNSEASSLLAVSLKTRLWSCFSIIGGFLGWSCNAVEPILGGESVDKWPEVPRNPLFDVAGQSLAVLVDGLKDGRGAAADIPSWTRAL